MPPTPHPDPAPPPTPATVRLVGAGPGDPGLLTVRGQDWLSEADLVLADALVSPGVLAEVNPAAELVVRGHDAADPPGTRERSQRDLIDRMIREAKAGRRVVRLKGGDPSVFGRGHEEADALLAAGVPVEIIPGVTAASAASALAGFPLTYRGSASAVCFVTGHEAAKPGGAGLDWAALAAFPGTRVFYMARGRLGRVADRLTDAGLDPATPAAVVSRAATGDQRSVTGTVATIAAACDAAGLPGPAVLFVGETASDTAGRDWWEQRPLHGMRVATCAADGGWHRAAGRLRDAGAAVDGLDLLDTGPGPDPGYVRQHADWLRAGDTLVFTSRNGVWNFFIPLRNAAGTDGRTFAGVRIACVGPSTAEMLRPVWFTADLIPDTHDAEHLAAALAPHVRGRRVLWPTCPEAKSTLQDLLTDAGAEVRRVHVYEQRPATDLPAGFRAKLDAGEVDWALVSSGNVARTFADLAAGSPDLGRLKVAAMSGNVAAVCRDLGLTVAAVAGTHTWDGLVDALLAAVAAERGGRSS